MTILWWYFLWGFRGGLVRREFWGKVKIILDFFCDRFYIVDCWYLGLFIKIIVYIFLVGWFVEKFIFFIYFLILRIYGVFNGVLFCIGCWVIKVFSVYIYGICNLLGVK